MYSNPLCISLYTVVVSISWRVSIDKSSEYNDIIRSTLREFHVHNYTYIHTETHTYTHVYVHIHIILVYRLGTVTNGCTVCVCVSK